jgi:hypothetical protein
MGLALTACQSLSQTLFWPKHVSVTAGGLFAQVQGLLEFPLQPGLARAQVMLDAMQVSGRLGHGLGVSGAALGLVL